MEGYHNSGGIVLISEGVVEKRLLKKHMDKAERKIRFVREYKILDVLTSLDVDYVSTLVYNEDGSDTLVKTDELYSFRMKKINHDAKQLDDIVGGFKRKPNTPLDIDVRSCFLY